MLNFPNIYQFTFFKASESWAYSLFSRILKTVKVSAVVSGSEPALNRILTQATGNGEQVWPVKSPVGQINLLKTSDTKFIFSDTMFKGALRFMYWVSEALGNSNHLCPAFKGNFKKCLWIKKLPGIKLKKSKGRRQDLQIVPTYKSILTTSGKQR